MLTIGLSTLLFLAFAGLGNLLLIMNETAYMLVPLYAVLLLFGRLFYREANCKALEGKDFLLTLVIVLLFLYDLIAGERGRRRFSAVACGLLALQVAVNVVPGTPGEVFGGMFQYVPMHSIVKSVLTVGTLIVFLQADAWLRRGDTAHKQGEFYILTLSTLLGMYLMVGAGNFLLFFIGMELASVPMACLVAFDKYKRYSAEAGAKYILCALFASGLMLYGISFFYGTTGALYFDDMAARITGSPLQIMAVVLPFDASENARRHRSVSRRMGVARNSFSG